ncbi:MAG: hypothetical protein ACE5FU_10000 [Nitrospinota bacterium]
MTFVIYFVLFLVLGCSTYLFLLNPEEISIHLSSTFAITLSPVTLILCSAACGIFLILIVSGFGNFSQFFRNQIEKARGRGVKKSEELFTKGFHHYFNGNLKAAQKAFLHVLSYTPAHLKALHLLGNIKSRNGEAAEAVLYHSRVREMAGKDIENLYALAADYASIKNIEKAVSIYLDIFELDRGSKKPYEKIRELFVQSRNWKKAIEYQRKIIALLKDKTRKGRENDRLSWFKYQMALESIKNSDLDEAKTVLRGIVKLSAYFIPAYLKLAETYFVTEKVKDAVQVLENGYKATGALVFMLKLAEHYQSLGDDLATVRAYRRGISVSDNPASLHLLLGEFFVRKGMAEEGISELERARDHFNSAPFFHLSMAKGYKALNRYDESARESDLAYVAGTREFILFECSFCKQKEWEWRDSCNWCGEFNAFDLDHKFLTEAQHQKSVQ